MLVTPWVPQTAVLGHPAVKGFLCHGGHTTSNEALATGKPILVMPFGGDQLVVAQHIKDHGYGLQVRQQHLMLPLSQPVALLATAYNAACCVYAKRGVSLYQNEHD